MMRLAILALAVAAAISCGPSQPPPKGIPLYSDHYSMRLITNPERAHALEKTKYKIVVRDKQTGQPVDGGEGLLYGNTKDPDVKVWDSFVAGAEPGTYYATVEFVVADNWYMAIRFHKDSAQRLEQVDWVQQVFAERPFPDSTH